MAHPILYSFRRCPYAIRARLAIYFAGMSVELREVVLRDKPQEMLDSSPKGTVPVLIVDDRVVDESLDVMKWALDEVAWCNPTVDFELVARNDTEFKPLLDRYKYHERYPEKTKEEHRQATFPWLTFLDNSLKRTRFLSGEHLGFEDAAIFPFIRQFANSDRDWFDHSEFQTLSKWLLWWENSEVFRAVMVKYKQWQPLQETVFFPTKPQRALSDGEILFIVDKLMGTSGDLDRAKAKIRAPAPTTEHDIARAFLTASKQNVVLHDSAYADTVERVHKLRKEFLAQKLANLLK